MIISYLKKLHLADGIVLLGLLALGIVLFLHIDYFRVPASDVFFYIRDGAFYSRLLLPPKILDPPVYSTILTYVSWFLPVKYPEIIAGISINIVLLFATLFLLSSMDRNKARWIWLVLIVCLVANPLTHYVTLQPFNTVLFTFVSILAVYLYSRGKSGWAYAVSSLGYFMRYESVALLIALGVTDMLLRKEKVKHCIWVIAGLVPAVCWEILIRFHNPHSNEFFMEVFKREKILPNMEFFRSVFSSVPFMSLQGAGWIVAIAVCMVIAGSALVFLVKKDRIWVAMTAYLLLYIGIHMIFPGVGDRYAYPVLWVIYAVLIRIIGAIRTRYFPLGIVLFSVFLLTVIGNSLQIPGFLARDAYKGLEIRLTGEWFEHTSSPSPALIILYNPLVASYYLHAPQVTVLDPATFACGSVLCTLAEYQKKQASDVFLLKDTAREMLPIEISSFEAARQAMGDYERSVGSEHLVQVASFPVNGATASLLQYKR